MNIIRRLEYVMSDSPAGNDIQLCTFDLLDGCHSPLSLGLHPLVLVGPRLMGTAAPIIDCLQAEDL